VTFTSFDDTERYALSLSLSLSLVDTHLVAQILSITEEQELRLKLETEQGNVDSVRFVRSIDRLISRVTIAASRVYR